MQSSNVLKSYVLVLVILVAMLVGLAACNSDLGIERVQFQCAADSDCGDGLACHTGLCADAQHYQQLCSDYCDTYLERCASGILDSVLVFEDKGECMEVCKTYPINGEEGATTGNTLQCRLYHLEAAGADSETHCPHASPRGKDFCGDTDRQCLNHCFQLMEHCTGESRQFETPQDCLDTCKGYRRGTVAGENGDTLECRNNHLAKAIEGVELELSCDNAGADSPACTR